jgi:CopG family nickel-responsive transcriptional regulator
VAVLRGPTAEVKALADSVTTQRGVRYGHLHILPEGDAKSHPEGNEKPAKHRHAHDHGHEHPHPHKSRLQSRKAD